MKIYRIKNIETGEEFEGSINEITEKLGRSRQTVQVAINENKLLLQAWQIEFVGNAKEIQKHASRLGVTVKCKWCGKEFFKVGTTRVYCSDECMKKSRLQMGRERTERLKKQKRKEKYRKMTLSEIANEASRAGMTYGKYVEKMGL